MLVSKIVTNEPSAEGVRRSPIAILPFELNSNAPIRGMLKYPRSGAKAALCCNLSAAFGMKYDVRACADAEAQLIEKIAAMATLLYRFFIVYIVV